jgi:hypothetical protein
MTRISGLILAVVVAGSLAIAAEARPATQPEPRTGALHITKECSEYQGQAGQFCTITSSNIPWIRAGMKVVYADAVDFDTLVLDTAIVLSAGSGSEARGHVYLNLATALGTVSFDGGSGTFKKFHATARVTVTDRGTANELWHWDGTYSFGAGD